MNTDKRGCRKALERGCVENQPQQTCLEIRVDSRSFADHPTFLS
jgi:hypothetical protein